MQMLGTKGGRLTAIIINIFGTILTVYLLVQFYSAFYALMIILFALSVSATQCRSKLKITKPMLVLNLLASALGLLTTLYLVYAATTAISPDPSVWETPVTISIYAIITLLNAIIIRNLHFPKNPPPPQAPCDQS
jgi:hypothetical protein